MNEWESVEKKKEEQQSLDDRLSAFYGPTLREQPLPASSWLRLGSQLHSQHSPMRRFGPLWRLRRNRGRSTTPTFIQDAFSRIIDEARLPYTPSMLYCSFKFRVRVPAVRVFPLGKRNIKLILPIEAVLSIEAAELDVLLAGGLARYLSMRKPSYAAKRLLLSSIIPLAAIVLAWLWRHNLPLLVFPIAIMLWLMLCVVTLWLLHIQRRKMALQADNLMVLWLGRSRACQGLHALEDRTRTPSRIQWGEPSLRERIGRICGTRVRVEQERLTLVR